MVTVSKSRFKPKALEYLRRASGGERILITDRGRPVADIIPHADDDERILKELRGLVRAYENPTEPVDVKWEAE